jgi:hypothetical protein
MRTLYVTDLDGTLLGEDSRLSERTIALLRPLIAQGLPLTVATARSPATVVDLLAPLQLTLPAVLMTGTMVYNMRTLRTLETTCFAPEAAQAVCRVLEDLQQEALAYCVQDGHLYVYYKRISCAFEERFVQQRIGSPYKTFQTVSEYAPALEGGQPLMFLLCLPDLRLAEMLARVFAPIPGILCYYYLDQQNDGVLLEIFPAKCTKASGLETIKQLTGAQRIISFGDNINDLSLFRASDESCAVANGTPHAKRAATRIIGPNSEDAVAEWIAAHWLAEQAQADTET